MRTWDEGGIIPWGFRWVPLDFRFQSWETSDIFFREAEAGRSLLAKSEALGFPGRFFFG